MKGLWLAFVAVLVVSFSVLGWIGTRIYQEAPPLPQRVATTGIVTSRFSLSEISPPTSYGSSHLANDTYGPRLNRTIWVSSTSGHARAAAEAAPATPPTINSFVIQTPSVLAWVKVKSLAAGMHPSRVRNQRVPSDGSPRARH